MNDGIDPDRSERVEMILQEVESIPTPSPIAAPLLRLASDESADIREMTSLIESDAGLTARLLAMCQRASTGLGASVATVERAVVMLGFDAVRSALLSINFHEFILGQDGADAEDENEEGRLDRSGLWRHSLAVACGAEMIAQAHRAEPDDPAPDEAFVCGLLHDLGKIALDMILPKAYGRAARLAEQRQRNILELEQAIIGLDHQTAGKRLAERWGLPEHIVQSIWMHGSPASAIPTGLNRRMIGVVTAADAIARRLHLGFSGNFTPPPSLDDLAQGWGFSASRLAKIEPSLHERVSEQSEQLGIDQKAGSQLLLDSLGLANRSLARLNDSLKHRARESQQTGRALHAIESFQREIHSQDGLAGALSAVARSSAKFWKARRCAIVQRAGEQQRWRVTVFTHQGRLLRSEVLAPPEHLGSLQAAVNSLAPGLHEDGAVAHWLAESVHELSEAGPLRVAPLPVGSGEPNLLMTVGAEPSLCNTARQAVPETNAAQRATATQALLRTWGSAIESARRLETSRRLGERLAQSMRSLAEMQNELTEARSFARLGELAAGAAHEMNNPLTVISGRGQLLTERLENERDRADAQAMVGAVRKLSELINALHLFASPPEIRRRWTDLTDLLGLAARRVREERDRVGLTVAPVHYRVQGPLPPAWVDPDALIGAVSELLRNAQEANPSSFVELRVQTEPPDDRLVISVRDDGSGMSERAIEHAFDPFFSEKEAGRRAGLGLARARRLVDRHGGRIELQSEPGRGTTARIILEDWRGERQPEQTPAKAA